MVSADRVQITLRGGAPWGFRLSGGGALPLIINKIRKKSQAHVQGLKEGDAVISINGVHVHDKSQDEALELVEAAGESLTLEIYRGEKDDLPREPPRKTIPVLSSGRDQSGTIRLLTTSDDGVSPGEVILIPSGDSVTLGTRDNSQGGGFLLNVAVENKPLVNANLPSGHSGSAPVHNTFSSPTTTVQNKSPVISVDVVQRKTQPTVFAEPFYDSSTKSSSPSYLPSNQFKSHAPNYSSSQPQPSVTPEPSRNPRPPPPVSPKPQKFVSYQPPTASFQPGVTSFSSTFDDGQTHRQVTREQHVQRSNDGSSTRVVQRETATTVTGRPSFVKSQTSNIKAIQPREETPPTHRPYKSAATTTTTLKTTTNIMNQKGPTPFMSSIPSNVLQPQLQTSTPVLSRSHDNQFTSRDQPPMFKPSKFVPGPGKDMQSLYVSTSPLPDFSSGFRDSKENVSPQPMFQVKNISSEKAKSTPPEVWRPNMWLPDSAPEQSQVVTPREDIPAFCVSKTKPGYSLVEEQKRKLLASHAQRNEYEDAYNQENQENYYNHSDGKHERLHIFAPPVEIHAGQDFSYEDQYHMDDYEDGTSSPDSLATRRKKNLYSDSAFYDTPGKSYPTIKDQMKLCKIIAQSLTSAANRRARGAKMFMKRKRKSTKWVHEGHSELSSSAGDVANLQDLDSELAPEESGNTPLMYFKIPSLKNRVGDGKPTKMALTQEEFEKLRLSSKKCDHTALPPDPCFDIVADLKAHKGRGGRLFERRRQRADKFVIDETNAKFSMSRFNQNNVSQTEDHHLNPKEVALKHGWKGDGTTSQNVQTPFQPLVHTSLKSDESPSMLKGKDFNRTAKGWSGGGEYPVAERLHHISPTKELPPSQSQQSFAQQAPQSYNRVNAWQATGGPTSAYSPFQDGKNEGLQQPQRQGNVRKQGSGEQRQAPYQEQTPVTNQKHRPAWEAKGQTPQYQPWPSFEEQRKALQQGLRPAWGDQRQTLHQGPRPKSWQAENYDNQNYIVEDAYNLSPVGYGQRSRGYPSVVYKQPIIPGTDL